MFGYVTVCEPELKMKDFRKYKSYYCGLCQTLKERHGHLGQLTLTYDMTFAIILLTSLYEADTKNVTHRCKVHPVKKQNMLQNEFAEYAADMNILLAFYHLKDDWQDEKKTGALVGMQALHKKAEKMIQQYPRQSKVIRRELKALGKLEAENSQHLDETAGCFGRLMAELFVYKQDMWEETLRKLGFYLGKFIYIMDAYDDLEEDLKENHYNPLKEMYAKYSHQEYEKRCGEILHMMMAETSRYFEMLPCLEDADILRNILYAGVWTQYHKIQDQRTKTNLSQEKGDKEVSHLQKSDASEALDDEE